MRFALTLLLSSVAYAQDDQAQDTVLPPYYWADFECDWTFNGATGTGYHAYTLRDVDSTYTSNVTRLWLYDGSTQHSLVLSNPRYFTWGVRWNGRVTSAHTDLTCSVQTSWDGTSIDYPWCVGTLNGIAVQQMSSYCDEL